MDSHGFVSRVNAEFQKIGLRGVSIFVASGDSGANGRTDGDCSGPTLLPDYPASSPYITSVGATEVHNPVSGCGFDVSLSRSFLTAYARFALIE